MQTAIMLKLPFFRKRRFRKKRIGKTHINASHAYLPSLPTSSKRKASKVSQSSVLTRLEQKQWIKRRKRLRILSLSLSPISLILVLAVLLFSPILDIQNVRVSGSESTLSEQAALQELLNTAYGANLLRYNTQKKAQIIKNEFPHLKSVSVQKKPFNTVEANIESFAPLANIDLRENGELSALYVVNELGLISGIGLRNDLLPTIVMDVSGALPPSEEEEIKEPTLNEEIIEKENLKLILESSEDWVTKFNIPVLQTRYLVRAREVRLYTEKDFEVWLDLTADIDLQFQKLKKSMITLDIYEEL